MALKSIVSLIQVKIGYHDYLHTKNSLSKVPTIIDNRYTYGSIFHIYQLTALG